MIFNNEETNTYISYRKKIDTCMNDQYSEDGKLLSEVISTLDSLIEKISNDSLLTEEHKNELVGIINGKKQIAPIREEETLRALKVYSDKLQENDQAFENALSRYQKLSETEKSKYLPLYKALRYHGFNIFFTAEDFDKMFTDTPVSFEHIKTEYPSISEDLENTLRTNTEKFSGEKE